MFKRNIIFIFVEIKVKIVEYFYKIVNRAKRIQTPTSDLNWDIYVMTVKNWINSCTTIEQLETTLPYISKYHLTLENKRYRDVIKEINLENLFRIKAKMILVQNQLNKINNFLEKYGI